MTWSIVARDASGALGVAVASRFFAVGALCPHACGAVGALSTQALVNPLYGAEGLRRMKEGASPERIVAQLLAADPGRDTRQLHMIDAMGRTAAHTGAQCIDWCGHEAADGISVAGNMLAGREVLEATLDAYRDHAALAFGERLIVAMQAGEAAGGDKRGRQAAALRIVTSEVYPALDLRVDDHADPLSELRRLWEKSLERFQPFVACLPTRADAAGITDRAVIERNIERWQEARRDARTRERSEAP